VNLALRRLVIAAAFARGALRALLLGAIVLGCPKLPPVSGCTPLAQSCVGGIPHVCSASQRLEPAGDTPCACVVTDAGVAICVRDAS
jgi:hypothetical protein